MKKLTSSSKMSYMSIPDTQHNILLININWAKQYPAIKVIPVAQAEKLSLLRGFGILAVDWLETTLSTEFLFTLYRTVIKLQALNFLSRLH